MNNLIYLKVVVRGEPDMQPLTTIYHYTGDSERILQYSLEMLKEKLDRNMRINVNEALLLYAYFVVSEMRAKKKRSTIEKNAKNILSSDKVLTGVAETLRIIELDAIVDGRKDYMTFLEPIPTKSYIMTANH